MQAAKRDFMASSAAAGNPSSSIVPSAQQINVTAPQITRAPSPWGQENEDETKVQNEELKKR
jgi:hypothetical protein